MSAGPLPFHQAKEPTSVSSNCFHVHTDNKLSVMLKGPSPKMYQLIMQDTLQVLLIHLYCHVHTAWGTTVTRALTPGLASMSYPPDLSTQTPFYDLECLQNGRMRGSITNIVEDDKGPEVSLTFNR